MNFLKATLAWIGIAVVLGVGIWLLSVKGSPWLLLVSTVALVYAIGKIGCQTH